MLIGKNWKIESDEWNVNSYFVERFLEYLLKLVKKDNKGDVRK